MNNSNTGSLTELQIAKFEEEGYLLLRGVLPQSILTALRHEFGRAVEEHAQKWFASGDITDKAETLPFETRYARLREQVPSTFSDSWKRILVGETIFRLWQQPELVRPMRSLIGDELYAHGTWNGRPRPPHQPVATIGWHQDAHYYRRFEPSDQPQISAWMPLVPVNENAGCLQVLPRSHQRGLLPTVKHARNGLVGVADELTTDFTPLSCVMEPGDVLLFGALTIHRALENNSDYVRWSLDIRYADATNSGAMDKAGNGYYCFSAKDPARVGSFESWASQYNYEGDF